MDNIKILDRIGADYRFLGTQLLDDETGATVSTIEKKCFRDPTDIKTEIASRWLQNADPTPTWQAFIQCLFDMEKRTLAEQVIAKLQEKGVNINRRDFHVVTIR